ncbi:uncharacterized protein LOC135939221 [Cloeon dipterum]|uniref:uncharacterized protein LOC135939221 n=1 Tax=Cloeon dipterum TaxID=197152 RepID=UPI00321FE96A
MDEEMEINNNDLNNNTDFEEEAQSADHLADMAEMNAHDIMKNTQQTLLRDAGIVRERIGYKVSVEEVYHHLEVVMDHENRVELVVEDLLERINNGEFASGVAEPIVEQEVAQTVLDSENSVEPNESLAYVDDDDSDDDDEDLRRRISKRKIDILTEVEDAEVILDEQIEQINEGQVEEQANIEPVMTRDLETLASLFPNRSVAEMRAMYLSLYQFEKENTVHMLAQQLYDSQDVEKPAKRLRLDEHSQNKPGPSGHRVVDKELLNYVCNVLGGRSRVELEQKCRELNWNQDLISAFVESELLNREENSESNRKVEAAVPSTSNNTPNSPQPGPSTEHDEPEVDEEDDNDDITDKMSQLIGMFPDADPEFLRHQVLSTLGKPDEYTMFIHNALEKNDLPTRKAYEERKKKEDDFKRYTGRMTVQEFLKIFPNPKQHFESNQEHQKDKTYMDLALSFLLDRFPRTSYRLIKVTLSGSRNMTEACNALETKPVQKTKRRSSYLQAPTEIKHLYFLQEATYLNKKKEIELFIKSQEEARKNKIEEAKQKKELLECPVCCEDECLFEDMTSCADGHLFCKNCVKQYAETSIGDNKTKFPCLDSNCSSEFPLVILKSVLDAKAFACLARRMQTEEIRQANIQDLETCPFCEFSYIPDENNALFECQSESCKKVSCRKCKEENHLPLRCEEVEKDSETQARRKIEEAMSEALLRECYKCKSKFYKSDGCNKMRCNCGALMCYICRQPIKDYNHFQNVPGQAANAQSDKCPLYSNNDDLHVRQIIEVGEQAKKAAEASGVTLKHDPTKVKPEATGGGARAHPGEFFGLMQGIMLHNHPFFQNNRGDGAQPEAMVMRRLEDLVLQLDLPAVRNADNNQPVRGPNVPPINADANNAPAIQVPPKGHVTPPDQIVGENGDANHPLTRRPFMLNPANPYRMLRQGQNQADRLRRKLRLVRAAAEYLGRNATPRGQQAHARALDCVQVLERQLRNIQAFPLPEPLPAANQNLRLRDVYMGLLHEQFVDGRGAGFRRVVVRDQIGDAVLDNVDRAEWNPVVLNRPPRRMCFFLPEGAHVQPALNPLPFRRPDDLPNPAGMMELNMYPQPPWEQHPMYFHEPRPAAAAPPNRELNQFQQIADKQREYDLRRRLREARFQMQRLVNNPRIQTPIPAQRYQTNRNIIDAMQQTVARAVERERAEANSTQLSRELINSCNQMLDYFDEVQYDPKNELPRFKVLYNNYQRLKDSLKNNPGIFDIVLFIRNRFCDLAQKHRNFQAWHEEVKKERKQTERGGSRTATAASGSASTSNAAATPSTSAGPSTAGPSTRPEGAQDNEGDTSPESDDYVNNFEFED